MPQAARSPRPPTPRWVKLFGIAFAVLVIAFIALHLTGHGFGAHMHGMGAEPGR